MSLNWKRSNLRDSPSLRGRQPLTVRPRSTSTNTRRPSIFRPSACLYAATTATRRRMTSCVHAPTVRDTQTHRQSRHAHMSPSKQPQFLSTVTFTFDTTQTCNQSPVTSQSLTAHGVFCQLQQPLPTRKHLVNKQKQQNDASKFDKCEQDANEPEKMIILRRRVLR